MDRRRITMKVIIKKNMKKEIRVIGMDIKRIIMITIRIGMETRANRIIIIRIRTNIIVIIRIGKTKTGLKKIIIIIIIHHHQNDIFKFL